MNISNDWKTIEKKLAQELCNGQIIQTEKWQSTKTPAPMLETLFPSLRMIIPRTMLELQKNIEPNLPWAEDHFQERVGGKPLNPGVEYANWPYYKPTPQNDVFRVAGEGQFSHTYMERFWCRSDIKGIRYNFGNLEDLVYLLSRESDTRQAFLPVWFPEDTGVNHDQRVPCTIGYHFILRWGYLHCVYYIRSCDFFRHLRDDVYLACRLVQWIIQQAGLEAIPGFLNMHITSLHCWAQEKSLLEKAIR